MSETIERHDFGAEVGRLLDLVVHSLYSEREIFLRELVANAADATDRRRFEGLTDPSVAPPPEARVRIVPDKPARTLTISDDGIGMSREEMVSNLGTIARSGTRGFSQTLDAANPEDRPSLIGQFGVGFYSAFMVADRVEVTSRKAGSEDAWTWASEGRGEFTMQKVTRETAGTDIVLHMKADADEYLEPMRLETVVRKWADHVTLPVTIARDGKDEPANEGTALWRKPRSEVTQEGYEAFYRHLGQFDSPWATLHWRAEGAMEYSALLFVPGMKPFEPVDNDRESHVRLHVRRMFITADAKLLPPWLRFVQGVVDTEDLPLNVSREMLQTTPVLARIRKAVTNRVLTELKSKAKEAADYEKFWENFGPVLKEGVWEDGEHRKELAPLLRFKSSAVEGWTSLPDYVGRMKPEQEAIYILAGDNADSLAKSAQLEGFRARGVEVLLLADPDRRVLAGPDGPFRGEADPQRDPGGRRPGEAAARGGAGGGGAGRLGAGGGPDDRPRRRRFGGAHHGPAGRQRGGAGGRECRARPADAAAAAPGGAPELRSPAGAGDQPAPPSRREPRGAGRGGRRNRRGRAHAARPRTGAGRRDAARRGGFRKADRGGAGRIAAAAAARLSGSDVTEPGQPRINS